MTTITEQGYQQFKMLSNNMMFRKHVEDSQNEIIKNFNEFINVCTYKNA